MLPIIGYKISFADVFSGLGIFSDADPKERFIQEMRSLIAAKHIFYLSSGTAASYLIFEALKRKSSRKDVILPAYTTRHLIFAIRKAGLNPVLCDVEKDGFNMDAEKLFDRLSANTSCVLCVHMFGLPVRGITDLRQRLPKDIFLIEDAAQAMGGRIMGKHIGTFGDIGFFSLNRGKNLPTYGGSCLVTDNDKLAQELD